MDVSSLNNVVDHLDRLCSSHPGTVVTPAGVLAAAQAALGIKFKHDKEQMIYEVITKHALASEVSAPGTFTQVIQSLSTLIASRLGGGSPRVLKSTPECHSSSRTTVDDVQTMLNVSGLTKTTQKAVMVAINLAGFCGRIMVEDSSHVLDVSVEATSGYSFSCVNLLEKDIDLVRPRVLLIDGTIEHVSELHHLLDESSHGPIPLLLVTRGISDDIKNTVVVNNKRNSLNVLPVTVPLGLEGLNMLNDIAASCATDAVASTKGQLISSVRLSDTQEVDAALARRNSIIIRNERSAKAVASQLSYLIEKRQQEVVDDVAKLLDDRIRSLSSGHVILRIPTSRFTLNERRNVDVFLRSFRIAVDHGMTTTNNERVPVLNTLIVSRHVQECLNTLEGIGAFVGLT